MQAALSLEPLLMLLGALARDLQADYLMYIPKILIAFSNLVDSGNPLRLLYLQALTMVGCRSAYTEKGACQLP